MPARAWLTQVLFHALPCSVGEECTEQVPSIIEACMQTDVALRPSAKDLVGMLQVPALAFPAAASRAPVLHAHDAA